MRISQILLVVLITTSTCVAEDFYYIITVSAMHDGGHARFYVKTDMNEGGMAKAMSSKDAFVFPQSYSYLIASDKWETVNKWDDLRTGVVIVRGDNILVAEKLVRNPEEHESKDRVFKSVPVKKSEQPDGK